MMSIETTVKRMTREAERLEREMDKCRKILAEESAKPITHFHPHYLSQLTSDINDLFSKYCAIMAFLDEITFEED